MFMCVPPEVASYQKYTDTITYKFTEANKKYCL